MGFSGGDVEALGEGAEGLRAAARELRGTSADLLAAARTMAGSGTGPAAAAAARFFTAYAALVAQVADQQEALAALAEAGGDDLAAATGQGLTRRETATGLTTGPG